jgi:hypothetical protein
MSVITTSGAEEPAISFELESDRAAAFTQWRAIAERVDLSDEEAEDLIAEAIAEARSEKRAEHFKTR